MSHAPKTLLAFNRGVISSIGLARLDLERMAMSAETQRNWVPRVLGSMMFRPGFEFLDRAAFDQNTPSRNMPFTFGVDDTALLQLGEQSMRVRLPNDTLQQVPVVTAAVTNSGFTASLAGWTDASEPGGAATSVPPYAGLNGDGTDFGILRQTITLVESNIEHYASIVIEDGPVRIKIGSTAGDDDYFEETRLDRGTHLLSFTPTTDFTFEIANEREFVALVDSFNILTQGFSEFELPTPWTSTDLPFLRWTQSGDVIYVACKGSNSVGPSFPLQKIERRGNGRSWGISQYLPEDGPFRRQNVSGVTITPSALNGDITLTSSQGIFRQSHADERALFRVASSGQTVTDSISGANVFTDSIRVVGSGDARNFGIIVEGTFVATVHLQFSFDDVNWVDQGQTWTAPISTDFNDGQDGQIIFYRIGVKAGNYTSGTVTTTLTYTGGSIQGVARVFGFTSTTVVDAHVLKDFGAITASRDWWEGEWSDRRSYPTSVDIHEGRLGWGGLDKIWLSVSDAFETFDDNILGDSGPISRSIGSGPHRVIHWLMSMGRLLMGTSENSANVASARIDGNQPLGARSSGDDEPLTPTNFNIKPISSRGVFVDRTEQRLYELAQSATMADYESTDLSVFTPDFNEVGIVQIAVQMKPDIRIHCVRSDGTVGMLVYDRLEQVIAWIDIDTPGGSGLVEDVAVLPGKVEDKVYYIVHRQINNLSQRHVCKWALESEAIGGQLNKQADSFVTYTGGATVNPFTTELLHLRGETVTIWADGIDVGTDVVTAAGALTNPLAVAAVNVVAGLSYIGQYKSAKLSELTGVDLLERKKVERIGFIAENLHYQGIQYGPTFTELYDLPLVEDSEVTPAGTIHSRYHEDNFSFGGEWDADSRICLQAASPRPATILAAIAEFESVERRPTAQRRSR